MADQVEVRILPPRIGDNVRREYANHLNINHSPTEFRLIFSQITVPLQSVEEITPEVVADLLVPVGQLPSIIQALSENYERYLRSYRSKPSGWVVDGDEDEEGEDAWR